MDATYLDLLCKRSGTTYSGIKALLQGIRTIQPNQLADQAVYYTAYVSLIQYITLYILMQQNNSDMLIILTTKWYKQ